MQDKQLNKQKTEMLKLKEKTKKIKKKKNSRQQNVTTKKKRNSNPGVNGKTRAFFFLI